jgi:chromosome segregation ATPase
MSATGFWTPLKQSVLWLSKSERERRRGLKTLAFMQWRAEAINGAISELDEHTGATTQRLADERRNFQEAHEALQATEADLQAMLERMGAVSAKPETTLKLASAQPVRVLA